VRLFVILRNWLFSDIEGNFEAGIELKGFDIVRLSIEV
jgi:hypothetical protein